MYLPVIRGILALNRGDPARAIEILQVASPYEVGQPPSLAFGFFGGLYPVYVRGLAYLREGRGGDAAAEFQKILDHRGVYINDSVGALAVLQNARALVMQGDQSKATAAYNGLMALWKDGDKDDPIASPRQRSESKQRCLRDLTDYGYEPRIDDAFIRGDQAESVDTRGGQRSRGPMDRAARGPSSRRPRGPPRP